MSLPDKKIMHEIMLMLLTLGSSLKGRLPNDNDMVDFALDYINYNEFGLAFETLCDYINEFNIQITQYEYKTFLDIARIINYEDQYDRMRDLQFHVSK
ncbi:MafI family immunity protein [Kingella denitrificans]